MFQKESVRAAGWLEHLSGIAIRIGRNGVVLLSPLLIGYLILGGITTLSGTAEFPYPFLSLSEDPVFNLLSFLLGVAIALASGGLLVLQMMDGIRGVYNQLSTILAGIGLGCSSAVIRFTHETALQAVLHVLRWGI